MKLCSLSLVGRHESLVLRTSSPEIRKLFVPFNHSTSTRKKNLNFILNLFIGKQTHPVLVQQKTSECINVSLFWRLRKLRLKRRVDARQTDRRTQHSCSHRRARVKKQVLKKKLNRKKRTSSTSSSDIGKVWKEGQGGMTPDKDNKRLFKKKCQPSYSIVFCWSLLLFYSDMVDKQ